MCIRQLHLVSLYAWTNTRMNCDWRAKGVFFWACKPTDSPAAAVADATEFSQWSLLRKTFLLLHATAVIVVIVSPESCVCMIVWRPFYFLRRLRATVFLSWMTCCPCYNNIFYVYMRRFCRLKNADNAANAIEMGTIYILILLNMYKLSLWMFSEKVW